MSVKAYDPRISVILKKNVGRSSVAGSTPTSKRFTGTARSIDLTPYLGESGQVVTDKSIREPAGMFSVTLADVMNPDSLETMYGLIEPMDVIEIRMARDSSKYQSSGMESNMPIVMRGFVTTITRKQTMGQDGRPSRSVVISGQDYGKILQILMIKYLPNMVTGQLLLTYFQFFANYSTSNSPNRPASQFISDVTDQVINAFIADMQAAAGEDGASPVLTITAETSVQQGIVAPFGTIQTIEGSIFDIISRYGDVGPWNELFIEDREAGPYLVYRPTPFKDADGALIQAGAAEPDSVSITDEDVVDISVSRSDSGVYNYYWVNPLTFNINTPGYAAVEAANGGDPERFYLTDYPNSNPKLYGFRAMNIETLQGPRFDGQSEADYNKTQLGTAMDFVAERRKTLMANNRDNVVFEDGNIVMKGNEAAKAGMTLKLTSGQNSKPDEYYIVRVQQVYRPFSPFVTTVSVERGMGFVNRLEAEGAPYLKELNVGGVYQ